MDKLNRVAHWIWDPVLVTVGWIAFLAGQSLQGDELVAKMTLLSAARVLPPGLVPARRTPPPCAPRCPLSQGTSPEGPEVTRATRLIRPGKKRAPLMRTLICYRLR